MGNSPTLWQKPKVVQVAATPTTAPSAPSSAPLPPGIAPVAPMPPSTRTSTRAAFSQPSKVAAFDPMEYRLTSFFHNDPIYQALRHKWSDRQQHGRLAYDTMYKHAACSTPFDTLVAFLKSYRPMFKPAGTSPTQRQRDFADFANEQLRRLGASGDSRQGYEKVIEWFGQGLKYGFSLAEMVTVLDAWKGQQRVQIDRILPLPQSSLDVGYNPLEEYGDGMVTLTDVRYRCFSMDIQGRITAVRQFYRNGPSQYSVEWTGNDLLRILHYTHGGGEGNPFGQSLFFTAFYHWGGLYTLEQMEEAFLDAGLPYLGIGYKTPDGRPSPELHEQVIDIIRQQDPSTRALIIPDGTFTSVAATNPSFTEHATRKKDEARSYIRQCIFGAHLTEAGSTRELDARNVIQVFFKYLLPALQREISTVLTWQFARRLIDANWSNVDQTEYPECTFQNVLDNDLRVSLPLLQQVIPFVDSSRFGEFLSSMVPGFDATWIPNEHTSSVSEERATADPAAGAVGKSTPPTKQPGSPDVNKHGQTGNVGGDTDTAV